MDQLTYGHCIRYSIHRLGDTQVLPGSGSVDGESPNGDYKEHDDQPVDDLGLPYSQTKNCMESPRLHTMPWNRNRVFLWLQNGVSEDRGSILWQFSDEKTWLAPNHVPSPRRLL